jgi:hypothetical protein
MPNNPLVLSPKSGMIYDLPSYFVMKSTFIFLLLGILPFLPVHADEQAETLVHKMVARDKVLSQHRSIYTYRVEETRDILDEDGKVTTSDYNEVQIQADKSPDYGTRTGRGIEADLNKASKEEPFNILQIISHYNYKLIGEENVGVVPCYKIAFTPKENQPYRNREEKVANELAGFLWIAKSDYSLVRNTGALTKSVSVAWFFATLTEMEFLFETKTLPNGEPGPSRIQYRFRVKVPFMLIHERHTRVMKDYIISTNTGHVANVSK